MCGRYATSKETGDLVGEFDIDPANAVKDVSADYNVAPTKDVPVVVARPPRDAGREATEPQRQLRMLKWGLVPSWAKDPAIGSRLINARMETVAEKPSFRRAFAVRRALIPADGYYEWYATSQLNARGKPEKQPFFIRPKDNGVLAMAGLYEIWRDGDAGDWLWTFTILTTSAEDSLGHLHDRMPLLVEPQRYDQWLDPRVSDPGQLLGLLVPAAPGRLEAYPVSNAVNNVRNGGPELIEPVALSEDAHHTRRHRGRPQDL